MRASAKHLGDKARGDSYNHAAQFTFSDMIRDVLRKGSVLKCVYPLSFTGETFELLPLKTFSY